MKVDVLTWNVHGWQDALGQSNSKRVARLLVERDVDVVALQEMRHPHSRWLASDFDARHESPKSTELELVLASLQQAEDERCGREAGVLPRQWKFFFQDNGIGYGGTAILTRLPVLSSHCTLLRIPDVSDDRSFVAVELDISASSSACSSACSSSCSSCSCSSSSSPSPSSFVVCCTHLDHRSERRRLAQLRLLSEKLAEAFQPPRSSSSSEGEPHQRHQRTKPPILERPHLLVGDLNALRREDYHEEEWRRLQMVREHNRWEPVRSDVVTWLQEVGGYTEPWSLRDEAPAPAPTRQGPGPQREQREEHQDKEKEEGEDEDDDVEDREWIDLWKHYSSPIPYTNHAGVRIDYVWMSSNFREQLGTEVVHKEVMEFETNEEDEQVEPSDHRPVLVRFCFH
ncbi:TNFR-Cys domain-containing protein [Balamuthia mandrillaris]